MDTVVITLFLITQFYVCKMDADYRERRRNIPQREKRWSMNSQRLEEIVAELMKPISDVRRSFDTDLSALLEEYLTEAGLHALDAEEEEINSTIPNFAELALLLQQSASIYSRKVDFLYQHVLSVSESLHNNTQEAESSGGAADEPAAAGARRKRKASAREPFAAVELEPCAAARREAAARPPPTLPPLYVELEPRVLAPSDVPLRDYAGEPIGLLADFHVAWRLQDGLLVEELAGGSTGESSLRALPLTELQAAIAAAAPPSPPPCRPPSPPTPPSSPGVPVCSTPLPLASPSPTLAPPTPLAILEKKERKRRSDVDVEQPEGPIKLIMNKKLRRRLQRVEEFSVPEQWVSRVVRMRAAALRAARRALAARSPPACTDFRGFDISDSIDVGGFAGWSSSEALAAAAAAGARRDDSDDDGFFEQSSLGDSDTSRESPAGPAASPGGAGEWSSWSSRVCARAEAAAARGADVHRAAAALLDAAQAPPAAAPPTAAPPAAAPPTAAPPAAAPPTAAPPAAAPPTAAPPTAAPPAAAPFPALLARTAHEPEDVSKLFLATLFLANAGNVEIVQGPPLTLNTFSVRVISTDERLYRTVAAADEQFLQ